jgi:hypothetical protein
MLHFESAELKRVECETERASMHRAARERAGLFRAFVLYVTIAALIAATIRSLLDKCPFWQPAPGGVAHGLTYLSVMAVALVVGSLAVQFVLARRYRAAVRRVLNEHGYPTCLDCGYDLRHLEAKRCPECGKAL